jgi:hypothetical protein
MASRAHALHHDSFREAPSRPRRQVWHQSDDPVVLPRSRRWNFNSALVAAALVATGVVVASGYGVFYAGQSGQPMLAETPALPLASDWAGDAELTRANVVNLLSGPAFAVPSVVAPENIAEQETDTPSTSQGQRHDYAIDDSAPGVQERLPKAAPSPPLDAPFPEPISNPYPNPTTTPPDGVAPPDSPPQTPTPALDPENPYR